MGTIRIGASAAVLLFALSACAFWPAPPAGNETRLDACRRQADHILVTRDRSLLYPTETGNTPFTAGPLQNLPDTGLAVQSERATLINQCLHQGGPSGNF